jgi:hypothetical protein
MLELTIQLGIIFVGKQILNNATELGVPYVGLYTHNRDRVEMTP